MPVAMLMKMIFRHWWTLLVVTPRRPIHFYSRPETWLGDAPNAIPAIAQSDDELYTLDPTYRRFLDELEQNAYPSIVLYPANDGMLHAFALQEDPAPDSVIGEELWAWIPGYLLYHDHDADWAGRLVDQMLYGRTSFLFDGSPVIDDVWIDEDGDGDKSVTLSPVTVNGKELSSYLRARVVQSPWRWTLLTLLLLNPSGNNIDESESTPIGYTTSRPVIATAQGAPDKVGPVTLCCLWGSGRAVPYSPSERLLQSNRRNI